MKLFSRHEKPSLFSQRPKSPTPLSVSSNITIPQRIATPQRPSHTPPPIELAHFPKPEPIPPAPREPQIIRDRYIDGDKLLAMCQARYGVQNCRLRYKNERYYLQAPEIIGEEILKQCETYARN